MRKAIVQTAAGICLFFAAGVLQAQTLSWEVKFLRGSQQDSVPISRQIRMETGDVFQIAIKADADCFSYVVFYNSSREIRILRNAPLAGGTEINISPLVLEKPSGVETVYVIMSLERQANLESLIQAYNNNPNSQQHANNLYREIVSLQAAASELGEPASAFIASGGTTRGAAANSAQQGTRFTQKAMYVRAITIRH